MKKLLLILLCLPLLCSCGDKIKKKEKNKIKLENTLTIAYSDVINDFKIKIIWTPRSEYYGYIGSATIALTNTKTNRTSYIINNFCSIENEIIKKIKITNKGEYLILEKDYNFKIDYNSNNSSFYFKDINFDNKKELLIKEAGLGQRGVNAIKVYEYSFGMHSDYADFWDKINYEPFNSLDDMSNIDLENKKIEIYASNGVCAGTYDEYIYNNRWIYSKRIIEKEIDFECYNYTYRVVSSEIAPYLSYNYELISIEKQ